ncbi:MAG TPA: cytochrome c3 family protein [Candidatus Hypogeohydataceae bacterium YC41]
MQLKKWAGTCRNIFLLFLPLFFSISIGQVPAQEVDDCQECHGNPTKVGKVTRIDRETGEVKVVSMLVDKDAFLHSAHGRSKEGFTCIDCHQDLDGVFGEHLPLLNPVDCVTFCHDDPGASYLEGSHHKHMVEKEKEKKRCPPTCKECHIGKNSMRETPVKDDPFHRGQTNQMCSGCHEEYQLTYCTNLHGQLSSLGYCNTDVANCSDCHGGHEILKSEDPESQVGEKKIVETCSKCHKGADKKFVRHVAHPKFKRPELYKDVVKAVKDRDFKKIATNPQSYLMLIFLMYVGIIGFTFTAFGAHSLLMWFRIIKDEKKEEEGHGH